MSFRQELAQLPTDKVTLRKFGLMVGGVFAALGAFLLWRDVSWAIFFVYLGAPLMVLGAILPNLLRPIYIGWMAMALVLGSIVTRVLLTIFFFIIITPVGLFFKLIGRDALHRKLDRGSETYWIEKEYPITDNSRYKNFF